MIEFSFKSAAEKYNGTYEVSHFNVAGIRGSINPISIYTFSMSYKDVLVNVKYEFGNYNLAEVLFEIPTSDSTVDFKIETRDNFSRLFSSKKNPWKITTKNNLFTSKLSNALKSSGLNKMADESSFEPTITGKNADATYFFKTTFYLGFEDKEHSLNPIIDFYQKVIEFINI